MSQTATRPFHFEMFSPAGERACNSLLQRVFKRIEGPKRVMKEEIEQMLSTGLKLIEQKHPEVYDTEPHSHFAEFTSKKLEELGYGFEISRWDI